MLLSRSPITRRMAAALAFTGPMGFAVTAVAAFDDDKARRLDPAEATKGEPDPFESWWLDLEKPEVEATRAVLNMADRREESIAFLKTTMKPLKITAAEVRALLLKLGSESETVWIPAFAELEYYDPRLAIDLETLMDRYKEAPTRQRMVEILSGRPAGQLAGKEIKLRKSSHGGMPRR